MITSVVVEVGGRQFEVAFNRFFEIAIGLHFREPRVRLYGGPGASKHAYASGDFLGSVASGGSCNVEVVSVTPHLDGTHTESTAHISTEECEPHRAVGEPLHATSLVTVAAAAASEVEDDLPPGHGRDDRIVSSRILEDALGLTHPGFLEALVVRTAPNFAEKRTANYDRPEAAAATPYFTRGAMQTVVDAGVRHLIVDVPSVDRLDDPELRSHHVFFRGGATDVTITELAFIPSAAPDGPYILNLQVPAWDTDAVPARPLLLPVEPRP